MKVKLFNHGEKDFEFKKGDCITQLVVEKIHMTEVIQVENLQDIEQGLGAFGSISTRSRP